MSASLTSGAKRASPSTSRRTSPLLLLVAAATAAVLLGAPLRHLAFAEPSASAPQQQQQPQVLARGAALRRLLLPSAAAAALGAPAPSFGESGVTKAWGVDSSGNDDEIHLGGVEWEDVQIGTGATPKVGQIVAINFVCTCTVRERDITIDDTKGKARDYRFGVGQMIPGLDEGVLGMKTGGTRILKIPGNMAFGKRPIPAAIGRPSVPPYTPVEVTVTLEFIPGADDVYGYATDDSKDVSE